MLEEIGGIAGAELRNGVHWGRVLLGEKVEGVNVEVGVEVGAVVNWLGKRKHL